MMHLGNFKKSITLSLLTILLLACNSNDPSPTDNNSKDRQAILTHWADNIIKPAYNNFKVSFDLMVTQANTFTASPDISSLTAFRAAWADAYITWQKVELYEFGPADKYTIRNFFNIYPTDVAGINAAIADPSSSLDLPATYARQGFPALDYLLNGVGTDDATILAYYTGAEGSLRLAYINRLTARMNTLLTSVITEWSGAARDSFISKTGLDIGSSMGLVVNAYVLYYERYIRSGKIGIPSGSSLTTPGTPYPEKVEAFYKKDISQVLAKTAHEAANNFFNGKLSSTDAEGPSFKSYLDALGAKDATTGTMLSAIINDQFNVIADKVNTLAPDFTQQIANDNQAMLDTYTAMQKLVRLLKVDMSSAMSVTITYTDNDGD